jgi:hypothetical protein
MDNQIFNYIFTEKYSDIRIYFCRKPRRFTTKTYDNYERELRTMIKEYVIESDSSDDKNIHMKLNLEQKKKQVLKGYSELIYINDFLKYGNVNYHTKLS